MIYIRSDVYLKSCILCIWSDVHLKWYEMIYMWSKYVFDVYLKWYVFRVMCIWSNVYLKWCIFEVMFEVVYILILNNLYSLSTNDEFYQDRRAGIYQNHRFVFFERWCLHMAFERCLPWVSVCWYCLLCNWLPSSVLYTSENIRCTHVCQIFIVPSVASCGVMFL